MLTLDQAIVTRKFYDLEAPVRALVPPLRALGILMKNRCSYVWQVAIAPRFMLLDLGLSDHEIDALTIALEEKGLRPPMEFDEPLRIALLLGCFPETNTPEFTELAVMTLMHYIREKIVDERTRFLVEIQRDFARAKIAEHRGRRTTIMTFPFTDQDGLTDFHPLGIMP